MSTGLIFRFALKLSYSDTLLGFCSFALSKDTTLATPLLLDQSDNYNLSDTTGTPP